MPSRADVVTRCTEGDIELVRLLYVGNDGVPRGYVVDAENVESTFVDGMNLTKGMQSFNALDHLSPSGPFGAVGSVRLIPDPTTFRELPYADRSAVMLCTMETIEGEVWEADPRSALLEFLETIDAVPSAAFESEFYLIEHTEDGLEPLEESVCFSPNGMQTMNEFVLDLKGALESQGMEFVTYYPEYGPGQQEFVVKHDEGVRAADNHVLFKQTVKGVASNRGYRATFVPKPFEDAAGSGCHIHLSLWDDGANQFYDPDADDQSYPLSETARQFIGGLLEHAPALMALTAPTTLSYKRLRPHTWASAYTCWGIDNREAMVRVPFTGVEDPEAATRFEFKPADNTANPYLALLGLLAAGYDGIERELDPGEPLDTNPEALDEEERSERDIERLPETFGEALAALEENEVLADALGASLFESYVDVKRSQWNEYTGKATEWELETLTRAF
ncbi:gamma-glutamylputrescine synthetase [Natrarchaeobius sp. A-rgal3]|uniref:gamma-glutamylputrescine synthetase n=1 Tax=Natrarchaeobius versutus TaxID=1679078 RepID=UPI0035107F51